MQEMIKIKKVALVGCSNGQTKEYKTRIDSLVQTLTDLGLMVVQSPFLYEKESIFAGTAKERAESLMEFYRDNTVDAIFDISGGDIANELLPYLNYEQIANTDKMFWGYSDLTTIINAIYTKTGKASVLYQVRNLIYTDREKQIQRFRETVLQGKSGLLTFNYEFVQGQEMEGVVVGGNIRCFLKLAGTPYFPKMTDKILLLESFHGEVPQIVTYLSQLKQMGVFEQIKGILLGTFTQLEEKGCKPDKVELVKRYARENIPIAVTQGIGHGVDSGAILIGKERSFVKYERNYGRI